MDLKPVNIKIAFAGPSGLGKSTLANFVSEEFQLTHPSTSAGDLFTIEDKIYLQENFGYMGSGHKNVINLSSSNPDFGIEFQRLILERRVDQILNSGQVVLDRCPIDNVVYILSQIAHNLSEEMIQSFIEKAQFAYQQLTHVIIIRFSPDIPSIEDNHSRVPNRFFQQYISDVFGGVYTRYFAQLLGPRVIEIDFWDLVQRKQTVRDFISNPQMTIDYEKN